jgi:hypothetical protein
MRQRSLCRSGSKAELAPIARQALPPEAGIARSLRYFRNEPSTHGRSPWLPTPNPMQLCLHIAVSPNDRVLAYFGGMEERRSNSRQRVFKAGSIEFDGTAVNCMVRNLSTVGAGIDVDHPVIPHCFTLNIPSSNMRQSCRVIWRKQKRIGLVFERVA